MTTPQLYEKTMIGKKTTYRPWIRPVQQVHEIESERVFSILSVVIISFMGNMMGQLPDHSRQSREIKQLAEKLGAFSLLHHKQVVGGDIERGLAVWDAMITELSKQIKIVYGEA